MVNISIKELLETGLYFGHQSKQYDPRMAPYIFGKRQGVYIIDLEKTAKKLEEACEYIKELAAGGKKILFVGTKKQAQEAVVAEAKRCSMPYVSSRWLGGTLTNWETIRSRVGRLEEIENLEKQGHFSLLTKKEVALLLKEKNKLLHHLEGIREMKEYPAALLIIDIKKEANAVREAKRVNIPVVAVVDTNSNPEETDYPVPANDDGIKGIKFLLEKFAESALEGIKEKGKKLEVEEKEKEEKVKVKVEEKKEEVPAAPPKKRPKPRPRIRAKVKKKDLPVGRQGRGEKEKGDIKNED